jgi:hypothetical protein
MKLRSPLGDRSRDHIDSPYYKNPWLLGYWLNKNSEGKGYVTEACRALMEYGIEIFDIDCFLAEPNPENEKSIRVLKRLGFEFLSKSSMKNMGMRSDWPESVPIDVYRKLI